MVKINKTKFKVTEIGKIPEDWELEKISDLSENIKYGYTESASDKKIGPKFLRGTDIRTGKINWSKVPYCKIDEKDFEKYKLEKGDIAITRMGTPGDSALIDDNIEAVFASYLIRLKLKQKIIPRFLYYFLQSNKYKNYISALVSTSATPGLNAKGLTSFYCPIPSLPEQKSIAKILSDLDSKIELLQKQNQILEKIGQALFKHWFVDFEFPNEKGKPYKSSGGKMVDSELGEIPGGWKIKKLKDLFNFMKGRKPIETSEEPKENWLPQILIEILDGKAPLFADPKKMIIITEKDPIMVMDGASSGRIEIGFRGILGSTLSLLKSEDENLGNLLYFFLKTKEEDINQNTTGTSIPHTDKNKVYGYVLPIPKDNKRLNRFQKETQVILNKIILNNKCIKSLQETRDKLLPKLMSGKIRVPVEVEA